MNSSHDIPHCIIVISAVIQNPNISEGTLRPYSLNKTPLSLDSAYDLHMPVVQTSKKGKKHGPDRMVVISLLVFLYNRC